MSEPIVLVSRYCPTCKAEMRCWKLDREDGKLVERCIDCGNAGLVELRETVGQLQS